VTMQLVHEGNKLYLLGKRKNELGGSEYYHYKGHLGANIPKPQLAEVKKQLYAVIDAINEGLIVSAHDISEGGVATTLVEMALGGRAEGEKGVSISLDEMSEDELMVYQLLFSETGGFVLEVPVEKEQDFVALMKKYEYVDYVHIGEVTDQKTIEIKHNNKAVVDISLDKAKKAWWEGLREKL
ncbi:phosphoribosylformylglycinamidine synthase, partial [Candidatus Peregrinibacteria bacterium]|nr:phosphoribosylformylglycinamidine synthase [Candidatus Peregrinibacteria bacterium]